MFVCLQDYEAVQSTNAEFNKAIVRVNVFHEHRQTVQVEASENSGRAKSVFLSLAVYPPI